MQKKDLQRPDFQLDVPKESKSEETPQEAKSDLKSGAEKNGDPVEEEEELEEISSMGGGSVQGYALPLGAKGRKRKKVS